jgi:hypothetical protein
VAHRPQLHLWAARSAIKRPTRSAPCLSPTELLIAVSTNSFRTCDACRLTAQSRFAPCSSRSTPRMFVGSLRQWPTFCVAYQACTAIPGSPSSRHGALVGLSRLGTIFSHPLPLSCLLLPFAFACPYLPHPENVLKRNHTSVLAEDTSLVTDATTNSPHMI